MGQSPIKPVYFKMDDPEQIVLRRHADSLPNVSDGVKQKLTEDKNLSLENPQDAFLPNPQELAALIENLLETKLAGRIIAADKSEQQNTNSSELDQFF